MLPSVLAQQLQQGVEDFLRTTFPISTPHFHGMVDRLLDEDGRVFKGPYLSLQLPFRKSDRDDEFFPDVPLGFRPFLHQEQAFERLSGDRLQSTLVATGTGSGKTESFLVPILDYCYRHRDRPGIKAILIYPMNALANDQAGRLAEMVWSNENLKGNVTAGLYVGQRDETPRSVMGPGGIITDKFRMRLEPPDILLTNYKMLDYLLVRPADFDLWKQNEPDTLRFIVVDELHTFDGAQGTDLACLVRRLKARLKTPGNYLCCVGTSATLGGEEAVDHLTSYAEMIFDTSFGEGAVITESRQSENEFLEGTLVRALGVVPREQAAALAPDTYSHRDAYIQAQVRLWFGDEISIKSIEDPTWRVDLGERLKEHPLFRNLLTVLGGRVKSLDEVMRSLARATPELRDTDKTYRRHLLDSLLALVSTARVRRPESEEDRREREAEGKARPTMPFLNLRMQLWLRELRRMLASVDHDPRLAFFDDLTEEKRKKHLPIVQCRDCGSTGWGALRRPQDTAIQPDLKSFYQAFFDYNPNVTFLFPDEQEAVASLDGTWCYLDEDLYLYSSDPGRGVLGVFLPDNRKVAKQRHYGHHNCPYCGNHDSLTILGSRAASLTSVLITQLYASSFNDDKKLIAFSDSVQDASHRAGFFGARTYRFNMRSAIQQFVDEEGNELTLRELPAAFTAYWSKRMKEKPYISTFIGPDMTWLQDWEHLVKYQRLPHGSDLKELVNKRVAWEINSEYGFRSRIGRSLEKSGGSIAYPDRERLEGATDRLLTVLQNEIGGLRELDAATLETFLVGFLSHLRVQGAVYQDALDLFLQDGGNTFRTNRHLIYMPGLSPRTRTPSFLTPRPHKVFDHLHRRRSSSRTWYEAWAEKCFHNVNPLVSGNLYQLYHHVLDVLLEHRLLEERTSKGEPVWGLPADALRISRRVLQFRCDRCSHVMSGAELERDAWQGTPCLRYHCGGRYDEKEAALDYYGKLYATGDLQRIIAHEHTGLLERDDRENLEDRFINDKHPWDPNLLSCTPTLEMGINIGDLSSVVLCSIPPAQANYVQRIGRAGRRDGNALNVAVANGRPHDLYFFAEPVEMIESEVDPPGVFLNAAAVLERQLTAYSLDRWVETCIEPNAIPSKLRSVLDELTRPESGGFPHSFQRFLQARREELTDRFIDLFGDTLSEDARKHVRNFTRADGSQVSELEHKIIRGLQDLYEEREGLTKTVQSLRRRVRKMQKEKIRDKNYETHLYELKQERQALQRIITEKINKRHTLNFLTDEGLIPNYAFPEAGITLRSIIYRKRGSDDESGFETRIYEYERPAVSAIVELAPANRFYAEGRNVEIDQVDLSVADIERWRFCDSCSYSEHQMEGESSERCPRCRSIQWADAGQSHPMVRLRQVFATTPDRESRTTDDHDDRRPVFYNKQLLVDFEEDDVTSAFSIDDEKLPFGFEFLSKASFREVNFGEHVISGPDIRIAGVEAPRRGFTICKHCGKVRKAKGDRNFRHTVSCPVRDADTDDDFIECVYLYREFSSEGIRILLPETTFSGSDRTLHSFIAALQLGLRKKFRGSIDHLQVASFEEPIKDSPHRKQSLVLYDTVPGGTGYLKELMRSPEPLLDVFEHALETLRSCSCNSDPEKDGCYRCLYAYRNSYDMVDTSRDRAIELLSSVLQHRNNITPLKSLRTLPVNALFDSELEAHFIAALEKLDSPERPVAVGPQVVGKKPGYYLTIGDEAYYIEPQVELGSTEAVTVTSRADFVVSPARSGATMKPIAVFADGWAYHKDRIGTDLAQRMAIAQSGQYHVWSLSWQDVQHALDNDTIYYNNLLAPNFSIPGASQYQKMVRGLDAQHRIEQLQVLPKENSFAWLTRFLERPAGKVWRAYAVLQALLYIDPALSTTSDSQHEWMNELEDIVPASIVDAVLDVEPDVYGYYRSERFPLRFFMAAPQKAASDLDAEKLRLAGLLNDDPETVEEPDYRKLWNGYLRLYNLFQFLPGAFLLTTRGVEEDVYDDLDLHLRELTTKAPALEARHTRWREAEELTMPEVHPLLRTLADKEWDVPEVGYEITDGHGEVAGMAELAWPDQRIALLYDDQAPYTAAFESQGWRVLMLEEAIENPDTFIEHMAVAE